MKSDWRPRLDAYEKSLERAADLCAGFVADFSVEASELGDSGRLFSPVSRWLTLSGVTGCGKTMLAEQTFAETRKNDYCAGGIWPRDYATNGVRTYRENMRRPGVRWMTATEFADRVRKDFDYATDLGLDLLVAIDDVGAARDQTAFVAEALYRLCNARLGKWTIFTTNFSLAEIGKNVDERVASRMIRGYNSFHRIAAGDYAMRPQPVGKRL